ncbi:metallophosphoesterase [Thomasclavelia saccharogumia]|uniref:metallophosphoesterase n=1 Tax=Thomasclavelia saccharogumia TaxID=341225 RepID=UPI00047D8C40|nr:metallophosphoesterase [Thomasclavelia saccharogumia]
MYRYMGLIAIIPGVIYFTFFINRFMRSVLNIHTNRFYIIILAIIITIVSIPAMNTLELYGVIYYHLLVITLILEFLNIWLQRFNIYRFTFITGILGVLVTVLCLGYGYYNIKHVVATTYDLSSDKIDDLKIIEIADLHMSTSLDVLQLQKYCDEMSELNADLVVLTGDIFDENTPLDDMVDASKALSTIKNKLGIYYVYGNHDNGSRNFDDVAFGPEEIKENLEKNGITVLEDEVITLDKINIIGRKDASFWGNNPRLATSELLAMIPEDKRNNYTIILDHQPLDLDENAALGIDLQLSGHTHGGQLFPMGIVQSLTSDTLIRGQRTIHDFTAITSSGMAGWRYPIKTGAPSEYVIINVK